MDLRAMDVADVESVGDLVDDAFIDIIARLSARTIARPMFARAGLAQRLDNDPDGCFVAEQGGRLLGALFSTARGTMGWFGPVGVAIDSQGRGVGQALVAECIGRWRRLGLKLMALETFPNSPFHLHLYSKFGFQPAWTGVELRKQLTPASSPPSVEVLAGNPPSLDFIYPGLDLSREVAVTRRRGAGVTLAVGAGIAVVHLKDALHTSGTSAFIPFLAAPDQATFVRLMSGAEATALDAGKADLAVRLCGSCWPAFQTLIELGYRPGTAFLRMKMGENLDFDRDAWYCDDWL